MITSPAPAVRPAHRRPTRRHVVAATLTALIVLATPVGAASAKPSGHGPGAAGASLVIADPTTDQLFVYRVRDLALTGQLDGVDVGTHAGTITLDDGRLLFVDDAQARVTAVSLDGKGRPRVVGTAAIPTSSAPWERAGWMAVDPQQRYLAVSSDAEGAAVQTVTVVDLKTYAAAQLTVTLRPDASGAYKETQVYLAGSPLQLVVTTGGRFETFPLDQVLAGKAPAATSSAPLGANNHGPVVAPDGSAVASTTADGLDVAPLTGATLGSTSSVAYSTTRDVVQSYRPRLARDGRSVWGAASEDTGLQPEQWADTRNDVNVVDRTALTSSLVRIPDGIASRLALSDTYAAVATTNPEGDALTLLDSAAGSPTRQRVVGTVALPSMKGGPTAGSSPAGKPQHVVALTPDGARAFVTNGGDGTITAVDTSRRATTGTITTPSPLKDGGYLTVVQPGSRLVDLVAR